jgi:hypothetical protein
LQGSSSGSSSGAALSVHVLLVLMHVRCLMGLYTFGTITAAAAAKQH